MSTFRTVIEAIGMLQPRSIPMNALRSWQVTRVTSLVYPDSKPQDVVSSEVNRPFYLDSLRAFARAFNNPDTSEPVFINIHIQLVPAGYTLTTGSRELDKQLYANYANPEFIRILQTKTHAARARVEGSGRQSRLVIENAEISAPSARVGKSETPWTIVKQAELLADGRVKVIE